MKDRSCLHILIESDKSRIIKKAMLYFKTQNCNNNNNNKTYYNEMSWIENTIKFSWNLFLIMLIFSCCSILIESLGCWVSNSSTKKKMWTNTFVKRWSFFLSFFDFLTNREQNFVRRVIEWNKWIKWNRRAVKRKETKVEDESSEFDAALLFNHFDICIFYRLQLQFEFFLLLFFHFFCTFCFFAPIFYY